METKKIKNPALILGLPSKNIENYIKFSEENDLNEIEISEHGVKVKIKRLEKESPYKIIPVSQENDPENQLKLLFENAAASSVGKPAEKEKETEADDKYHKIVSPIVGTFYRAPSPDSPPFVKEGDSISKGDTLCIVEAMKVMNKINSDVSGKIVKILPKNEQPVKQGDTLFLIEQ